MNDSTWPNQISSTRVLHEYQQTVSDLFADRLYLTMDETAGILGIEVKTLREMANAGRITCLVVGSGVRRPRRRFTRQHVAAFLEGRTPKGVPAGEPSPEHIREAVRRRVARHRN